MPIKENFFFALNAVFEISRESFNTLYFALTGEEFITKEEKMLHIKQKLSKELIQNMDKWLLPVLLSTLEAMKIPPRTKLIHLINDTKDKEKLYKLLYMIVYKKTNPKELSLLLKENKIKMLIEVFERLEPVLYNRLSVICPKYSSSLGRAQRNETGRRLEGALPSKSRIPVPVKGGFKATGHSSKKSTTLKRKHINPNKVKPFLA